MKLTTLTPDRQRAERVKASCRMELAGIQIRSARTATVAGSTWQVVAPALVGLFCVLYTATLLMTTLRLEGSVRH